MNTKEQATYEAGYASGYAAHALVAAQIAHAAYYDADAYATRAGNTAFDAFAALLAEANKDDEQ